MFDTTNLLWYSSIAVEFLFCLYLIWVRLANSYPIFTVCLGCSVGRSLAALYFMRGAVGPLLPLKYTYFWLWSEPFWLLLQLAVAFEVHTKMWKSYRAVLKHTCPLLAFAFITALVSAAVPMRAELNHANGSRLMMWMHFEFLVKRYESSVLAVFLILSGILFLIVVHDAWETSLFRHEGMFAAYLGIYATACFIIEMEWSRKSLVNGYVAAALTVCFVVWIGAFRPQEVPNG